MRIQVIGAGCEACGQLYEDVLAAVEQLGLEAEVEKVDDLMQIVRMGVMSVPAVMVDGRLIVSGTAPNAKRLAKLLSRAR